MSKSNQKISPPDTRCPRCIQLHNTFIDLSADEDDQLEMLAALMMGRRNDMDLDFRTVAEISHAINSYLQKKRIREAVFLGRSLRRCTLDGFDLTAELGRVRAYRQDAEKKS